MTAIFVSLQGTYRLEVFVKLLGSRTRKRVFVETLEVSHNKAEALNDKNSGLYFDWGPDSSRYLAHIDSKNQLSEKPGFMELISLLTDATKPKDSPPETTVLK
jgi:hypothetical protein